MKIPEGFTPRGEGNEQPLETYDKRVWAIPASALSHDPSMGKVLLAPVSANKCPWKVPDGPCRIVAWKLAP